MLTLMLESLRLEMQSLPGTESTPLLQPGLAPVSYQVEVEEAGLSWRRHIDLICARLNPETVVLVVPPADSEKPTKESTPRSNYPTIPHTKLSNSPSPTNAESPVNESLSTVQTMNTARYL